MSKINLLPWREKLREQRKKSFYIYMGVAALTAVMIVFIIGLFLQNNIRNQKSINTYLKKEIAILDQKIISINSIKNKKIMIKNRMVAIRGLQGNRFVIVRIFDQLARIVPEGVYFKSLDIIANKINLVGVAESNNKVAVLMRELDKSPWFDAPNLTAVRRVSKNGEILNVFDLTFYKGQRREGK